MNDTHLPKVYPGERRRLEGIRFGKLVVERYVRFEKKLTYWSCRCDCGQVCEAPAKWLIAGKKGSCGINGCHNREIGPAAQFPSEYKSWQKLRARCNNPNDDSYPDYGARGIRVSERWDSFELFLSDMGPKPTPKHTIEREDNDLGYEPMNCHWATAREQARNTRRSVYVEYQGERLLLLDLCDRLGLSRGVIYGRLKNGWDIERALTTPVRNKTKRTLEMVPK